MKKVFIIILTAALAFCMGCSIKKDDALINLYEGENEHWSAKFQQDVTEQWTEDDLATNYHNEISQRLVVTYKNAISDFSYAKYFEITCSAGRDVFSRKRYGPPHENPIILNDWGAISVHSKSIYDENSGILDEDSVITVTIKIDDDIQTFDLIYTG